MLKVFKYNLPLEVRFSLRMPSGAKILAFQTQNDTPKLWALVDPDAALTYRDFLLIGTGDDINVSQEMLYYIGTCQMTGGARIFHLFEFVI